MNVIMFKQLTLVGLAGLSLALIQASASAQEPQYERQVVNERYQHMQPTNIRSSQETSGGGVSSASVSTDKARQAVSQGHTELKSDTLSSADVDYNLQQTYIQSKTPKLITCNDELVKAGSVDLEGVHLFEPVLKERSSRPRRDSQGGTVAKRDQDITTGASIQFLKATVYFKGYVDSEEAHCADREFKSELKLVRFSDGVWYAPAWRQSLVKRR